MITLDKHFTFLVIKLSGVRFAEVSFRNYFVNWVVYMARIRIRIRIRIIFLHVLYIAGPVASGVQWRSGFRWQSS